MTGQAGGVTSELRQALATQAAALRERLIGKPWADYWQAVDSEPAGGLLWSQWWPIMDTDGIITGWLRDIDGRHVLVSVFNDGRFGPEGMDAAMTNEDWSSYCAPRNPHVLGGIETGGRSRHD